MNFFYVSAPDSFCKFCLYFSMAANFSYWDDCVDPQDLEAMWNVPEVSAEWLKVGEERGRKVHLSRDPDGQPYLTQTEMRVLHITLC